MTVATPITRPKEAVVRRFTRGWEAVDVDGAVVCSATYQTSVIAELARRGYSWTVRR